MDSTISIRRILIIGIIALLLVAGAYRYMQIPVNLIVSVKVSLYRQGNYSSGYLRDVYFGLTIERSNFDNVTLVERIAEGNPLSTAYWKLVIVANQSTSKPVAWTYEILRDTRESGQYAGTISTSFRIRGTYTVWVLLFSVRNDFTRLESSFSEVVFVP